MNVGREDRLRLFAAGSLAAALGAILGLPEARPLGAVDVEFAASGVLRQRIVAGDVPDVFASADLGHPRALEAAGLGGPPIVFARNALCVLARPGFTVTSATLLDVLLDPRIRVGTSTPGFDPSGDYAFAMFARADRVRPGAGDILRAKALRLTGAPGSRRPPPGRSLYAWLLAEGQADLFVTYRSNAILARREHPPLVEVPLPPALAVVAAYGLIVTRPDRPRAWRLAALILSSPGQAALAAHGFGAPGLADGQAIGASGYIAG